MNLTKAYNRKRLMISIVLALGIHGIIFFVLNYFLPPQLGPEDVYTGPVIVTIDLPKPPPAKIEKRTERIESPVKERIPPQQPPKPEKQEKEIVKQQKGPPAVSEEKEIPKEISRMVPVQPSRPSPPASRIVEEKTRVEEESEISEEQFAPWFEEQSKRTLEVPKKISPEELAKRHLADIEKGKTAGEVFKPEVVLEEEKPLVDIEKFESAYGESGSPEGAESEGGKLPGKGEVSGAFVGKYSEISWENPTSGRKLLSEIPEPDIPEWVKKRGFDLKVVIRFSVSPKGTVSSTEVKVSSGYSDVDASVVDAVRKLRFTPVKEPGEEWGEIEFLIKTR